MPRSAGDLLLLAGVASRAEAQEWLAATRAALPPFPVNNGQVLQHHGDRLGLRDLSGNGRFVSLEQVGKRVVHGISPVVKITTSPSRCE